MEVTKVKRPTMNVGQDEPASVVCGLLALKIEIPWNKERETPEPVWHSEVS